MRRSPCCGNACGSRITGNVKMARPDRACHRLSKNPFGVFRQFFAVCRAHSLCAYGAQLAHLQPEKCFRPRTRRGRKRIERSLLLPQQTLRGFFDTLWHALTGRAILYLWVHLKYSHIFLQNHRFSLKNESATMEPYHSSGGKLWTRRKVFSFGDFARTI